MATLDGRDPYYNANMSDEQKSPLILSSSRPVTKSEMSLNLESGGIDEINNATIPL